VWTGLLVALLALPAVSTAGPGDSLLGRWCTEECEAVFDFYAVGGEYRGRLYPKKYPGLIDSLNPVDSLRNRKLAGQTTIYALVYNAARQRWENGRVYNPENGKIYRCTCKLRGADLVFRGFLGVSLLGQSQVWTRVDSDAATPDSTD
jgi:uncharacterized protein (DUF2147 family)